VRASSIHSAILDVLDNQIDHHLTANEIYEEIRQRLPAVNPSSVYRGLERLTKEGLVSVSDMGMGAAVFEAVHTDKHHHLVCQVCGITSLLDQDTMSRFFDQIEAETQYRVSTNHLVLFGICPECQAKRENTPY